MLLFLHTYNISQQDKSFGAITTQPGKIFKANHWVCHTIFQTIMGEKVFVDGFQTGHETYRHL